MLQSMKAITAATVLAVADATNLALTWRDCGGAAKISSVSPKSVPLGVSTEITGTGTTPVGVNGGNFHATVKAGWIPLASCSGPLGPSKKCSLPLGAGSLTLEPIALPIAVGTASISLSVDLAASLPAQLASTTTHVTATSSEGQKVVCLDVYLRDSMVAAVPDVSGGGCTAADKAAVNAAGGGDSAGSFPVDTEECAKAALSIFKGIDPNKFDSCLTGRVAISKSCAQCYWKAAQYGFEKCKFSCLSSWCSSACLSCSAEGAKKADQCAGFTSTSKPVPCDFEGAVV